MADFEFSITDTGRGSLQQFRTGERRASFMATTALTEHPLAGPAIVALRDGIAAIGETIAARVGDLTQSGLAKLAREMTVERIAPDFRTAQAAVGRAEVAHDKHVAELTSPPAGVPQPGEAVRVERRQYARSLPLPKLLAAVLNDPSLAAAVVEGGQGLSGLPSDVFAKMERDAATANLAARYALQHDYRTAPSADDPVGGKPDEEAARSAAEAAMKALDATRDMLADAPNVLASAVSVVALLTDTSRDEAFVLLTGQAA